MKKNNTKKFPMTRRQLLKAGMIGGVGMMLPWKFKIPNVYAAIAGGTLDPGGVEKFVMPLIKPPAMPTSANQDAKDLYRIAVRQFYQPILPNKNLALPGGINKTVNNTYDPTKVWSYGNVNFSGTAYQGGTFNYPAFTIEATVNKKITVEWRNELIDNKGNYLPHILPVDQTLHWANPPGGTRNRDKRGFDPTPYTGPVPIVTHVHGAHTTEESDGYPEAWWLPNAKNIPRRYARTGTFYDYYVKKYNLNWDTGTAQFDYKNDQPATTLWYHDHALGMTRLNVYAGPAGFWLIRGGQNDIDLGYVAPGVGDSPFGEYTEIPIAIQDRSFNTDGSLFYPDNRAFFEGLNVPGKTPQFPGEPELNIPFIPDNACNGASDVSPIWNPEFFGNMMVVNGYTWPYLEVEQRRYRFRFLNGCNSRFLVLKMTSAPRDNNTSYNTPELNFWQIGAEQGFLPDPVELGYLLMGPAERADVIVDFSDFDVGDEIFLVNDGPDAPFGGISLGEISDYASTGLVMKFKVKAITGNDNTTSPGDLELPAEDPLGGANNTRRVSLNEKNSATVKVSEDVDDNVFLDCATGEIFGPTEALLGTYNPGNGTPTELHWADPISENPTLGHTEIWEIFNFTADAHPIHVHLVRFEVVNRQALDHLDAEGVAIPPAYPTGPTKNPEVWEAGYKDTVIAYPGEVTRIKMKFDLSGFYVWHCHIVEHEDNEMMRPFHVGPIPKNAPAG